MDITIPQAAERLGTSIPRVRRAIARLGIRTTTTPSGDGRPPRMIDGKGFRLIRDELGSVPIRRSRSREELFVLGAFNINPFGFRSRRDVANATGMSPTTTSVIVDRLLKEGIIKATRQQFRNSGTVIEGIVLDINRETDAWSGIVDEVLSTHLPRPRVNTKSVVVPRRFWHLFWNASPAKLRISEHADYVASRMLLSKDPLAVSWAVTHLPAASIEQVSSLRQASSNEMKWLKEIARAMRLDDVANVN